jgi:uncharacterized membrane protein
VPVAWRAERPGRVARRTSRSRGTGELRLLSVRIVVRLLRAVWVLTLLSTAACSSPERRDTPDAAPVPASCAGPERVPTFGDLQRGILPICLGCHSAKVTGDARHGAPDGVNFDTYEELAKAAEIASYLVRNRLMPAPDGQGPTEEQRRELYDWTACGKLR